VRASVSRGIDGTPNSEMSKREVPMGERVARALELHQQKSEYKTDDNRVFCHRHAERPYDASKMRDRFCDQCAQRATST